MPSLQMRTVIWWQIMRHRHLQARSGVPEVVGLAHADSGISLNQRCIWKDSSDNNSYQYAYHAQALPQLQSLALEGLQLLLFLQLTPQGFLCCAKCTHLHRLTVTTTGGATDR